MLTSRGSCRRPIKLSMLYIYIILYYIINYIILYRLILGSGRLAVVVVVVVVVVDNRWSCDSLAQGSIVRMLAGVSWQCSLPTDPQFSTQTQALKLGSNKAEAFSHRTDKETPARKPHSRSQAPRKSEFYEFYGVLRVLRALICRTPPALPLP